MKTIQYITSIGILVSTASLANADIEGRDIRFEDCPASVQNTITENARGGNIDDVEFITFKGRKIYIADVELPRDKDLEVYVFGDGTLLKTREDIRLKEAPAAVRKAAKKFAGRVDDVDKEITNGKATYQIEIDRMGRPDRNLRIAKDGTILDKSKGEDPYDIDFSVQVSPENNDGKV